jgi:hypothetical protein
VCKRSGVLSHCGSHEMRRAARRRSQHSTALRG